MKRDLKRASPVAAIHLAGLLFVASALAVNPFQVADSFFSDEAVYYTMAHSFASDGDMEFRMADLERAYKESSGGPQGIILKVNERDRSIVFGKGYLYSLTASPLVKILKTNGLFLLNALLLWLNLLCGYRFFSAIMSPLSSILCTFFFFLANATVIYVYWMTPEYFGMSLVCYGFFFFTASTYLKST
ncbi:MAG TPA: hypothetical protein VJ521_11445, partial [Acidobacteriota bacterium]|nr:hypothetical protein [Acidobacteriota bacterium]